MRVKVIRTNGSEEKHEIPASGLFARMEKLIDARGGLGSVTLDREKGLIMWVDDTGLLQEPRKPMNPTATALYLQTCRPGTNAMIVGDVAITKESDYEADLGQGEEE